MGFKVGQRVRIQQRVPGGPTHVYRRGVVAKVGKARVDLDDGSRWRVSDGYAWGSRPERGFGRYLQRQIVAEEE